MAHRTVMIVDDHPAFRAAARAVVEAAGFEVVREAADGSAALAAVIAMEPDVVLLDVRLPGLDGFAVAEELAARARPPCVVLMSATADFTDGERLARARVCGFIAKKRLTPGAFAAVVR